MMLDLKQKNEEQLFKARIFYKSGDCLHVDIDASKDGRRTFVDVLADKDVVRKLSGNGTGSRSENSAPEADWNPMQDEFQSNMNAYEADRELDEFHQPKAAGEDRDVVMPASTAGGAPMKVRICRFFRETGKCYKGDDCEDIHVQTGRGMDRDGVPVNILSVAHHEAPKPEVGAVIFVKTMHVNHLGSFYVTLPLG